MDKIKILIIAEAMLGGIRQHVFDIVKGLDKSKYEVYLAYSDYRADELFFYEYKMAKHTIHMIRCEHMYRELSVTEDLAALKEIKGIIKEIHPDIVHCHSSKAGIVGRLAARICGVKKIYYTPNAYSFQNPRLGRVKRNIYIMAEKILTRFCTTKTINVSMGEMECAIKNGLDKRKKFILIYNGIPNVILPDRSDIRKKNGFTNEQILIGVTSRCAEQKDPFTWLETAKSVIEKNKNVHFVYIGDGNLAEPMQEWIKNNQLQERIHMLGFRSNASVLVSMFDIYFSTAIYEGLPYSMIEAMRAGVPIIATDVVGNNELVVQGRNGMLFQVGQVEQATRCIVDQIGGKIKIDDVISTYKNNFSSDVMIQKIEMLYEALA